MLRRYARLMLGQPGNEAGGTSHAEKEKTVECTAGDVSAKQAGSGKRKFKLSAVVDQGDDQEVVALQAGEVRGIMKKFKAVSDDLDAEEDEEATADQLQGIKVKLDSDVVPYADFGIIRPFGGRLGRALKFRAKFWDPEKNEYVTRELPGPPCLSEWERSWKVYSFIMIALGAVSKARLERYQRKIAKLARKYSSLGGEDTWWNVVMTDQRMREEKWREYVASWKTRWRTD